VGLEVPEELANPLRAAVVENPVQGLQPLPGLDRVDVFGRGTSRSGIAHNDLRIEFVSPASTAFPVITKKMANVFQYRLKIVSGMDAAISSQLSAISFQHVYLRWMGDLRAES
jgi:hypothetical protein